MRADDYLHAYSSVYYDGGLWYSAIERNGLYRYDVESGQNSFIMLFPREKIFGKEIHRVCVIADKKLFFFPYRGDHIHVYFIEENRFELVEFNEEVYDAIVYECGVLVLCGLNRDRLYEFNIDEYEITRIQEYENNKSLNLSKAASGRRFYYHDGKMWFGCLGTNKIVNWDVKNRRFNVFSVDADNIFAAFPTKEYCWIIGRTKANIYAWDYKDRIVMFCPHNIALNIDSNQLGTPARYYNNICMSGNALLLMPAFSDSIVSIVGENVVETLLLENNDSGNSVKYFGLSIGCGKTFFLPNSTNKLVEIDSRGGIRFLDGFRHVSYEISLNDKGRAIKERMRDSGYVLEDKLYGIADFIDGVVNMKSTSD